MSRRIFQDDRMPWSLFLPMTMAVAVGVLIADGVRYAIGEVFAARAVASDVPMSSPNAAPVADTIAPPSTAAPGAMRSSISGDAATTAPSAMNAAALQPQPAGTVAPTATASSPAVSPSSSATAIGTAPVSRAPAANSASPSTPPGPAVEQLQGSIGARRDQQPRACINGTVAVRDRNGWQQELSGDRPVRCEQTGP